MSVRLSLGKRIRRDYATTAIVEALTMGSGLVLFHLIADRSGPEGFAYFQVARGVVSALQPALMLGFVVGLQRYLPVSGATAPTLSKQAFLMQLGVVLGTGGLGWAVADDIGRLLGLSGPASRVEVIFVALAGGCLLAMTTAALRGSGQVAGANAVALLGIGVIPLLSLQFTPDLPTFLTIQGVALAAVAAAGLVVVKAVDSPDSAPPPRISALIRYGARRTPGDLALPALFAVPTFYVAHATGSGPQAGYVGFAMSAVVLVCSVFALLSPVAIPLIRRSHGMPGSVWRWLTLLPLGCAAAAALLAAILWLGGPIVVRAYLGDRFIDAVPVLRAGLLCSIPMAAFYGARPTLDALQDTPVTVKLLLGCLVIEVAGIYLASLVTSPVNAAMSGLGFAAMMLGVLSVLAVRVARPARLWQPAL